MFTNCGTYLFINCGESKNRNRSIEKRINFIAMLKYFSFLLFLNRNDSFSRLPTSGILHSKSNNNQKGKEVNVLFQK